jgi:hypothetical protein
VSFAAITLYVASQRIFIVVIVYFVVKSARKLSDTPSHVCVYSVQDKIDDYKCKWIQYIR